MEDDTAVILTRSVTLDNPSVLESVAGALPSTEDLYGELGRCVTYLRATFVRGFVSVVRYRRRRRYNDFPADHPPHGAPQRW